MSANDEKIVMDITVGEHCNFEYTASVVSALDNAWTELQELDAAIEETTASIEKMTPQCDKLDYALAAGSGALCGIIDIFLVGKPGQSPLGNITDKWFAERTKDFAKMCGWDGNDSLSSAIRHLEKKFKIPYDQNGLGDAAKDVFDLTPKNHHFKSLGHNPTLVGLFFSILDQFTDTSHFVSGGELIAVDTEHFELRGKNIPAKLMCGFVNWFGHLMSDVSGSSGSKNGGMGIPSPLWAWVNDIIVLRRKLNIPPTDFDRALNETAVEIFRKGFDMRFQTAQAIPVFVNEMLVRFMYSLRRIMKYFKETDKSARSFKGMWETCEPFSNVTVKRMLTVAHGTFCLMDVGDAVIRGFAAGGGAFFNPVECVMRLNIAGIGRFAVSLYGEAKNGIARQKKKHEVDFMQRQRIITVDYIEGLKLLAAVYNDSDLLNFTDDLKRNDPQRALQKTVKLALLRNVPEDKILKNMNDIDNYFLGGKRK